MKNPELRAQNRRALIFLLLGVLLAAVLASLPLFHFSAVVYSKKSPNTFVGDETYRAVKAEVEAIAADYSAQGLEVKLIEEVIERVNSKGETTSLVSFSLSESFGKNLWSFLGKGLASSFAALGLVLGLGLSGVFALLGLCGSIERPVRELDARSRRLRGAACVSALLALLLRDGEPEADAQKDSESSVFACVALCSLAFALLLGGALSSKAGSKRLAAQAALSTASFAVEQSPFFDYNDLTAATNHDWQVFSWKT